MPQKQLSNLLVKPAGADCNLRCAYCFYLEKCALYPEAKTHRMSDEVLSAMIEQMMVLGGRNPTFGWQGGEPTLMGLDFFRRVVALQRRFGFEGQVVGNGLQTNGLVIDEEWTAFLRDNQFLVGLSLDGPQHVHDRYRLNAAGHGSWERVRRSARLLLDGGVAANALVVVSDYSSRYPEEIYDFLKAEGFDFMQFIPIVEPSADGRGAASFSLSPEAFGDFMRRVFDRWLADFVDGLPTVSVRWFDSLLHLYLGLPAPECPMQRECGVYLCVEHNGDCYPCDFFVESDWRLGNVLTDRLDHMLDSEKMTAFGRRKADLPPECDDCHWFPLCFGGCTKDRLKDPSDRGLCHFCAGYRAFFEHADRRLRRVAKRVREERIKQRSADSAPPTPGAGEGEKEEGRTKKRRGRRRKRARS